MLFLLLAGFPIWSQGQIAKESLYGYFKGVYRYFHSGPSGGMDSSKHTVIYEILDNPDYGDCIVNLKFMGEPSGFNIISTYDLGLCDRPDYNVSVDTLWRDDGYIPHRIYFFGTDSIFKVSAGYMNHYDWAYFDFKGSRISTFQALAELKRDDALQVFPNPATHNVHILFPFQAEVAIYNWRGQVMIRQDFDHQGTVDVGNWPKGVYVLELKQGESKVRKQFVVQ